MNKMKSFLGTLLRPQILAILIGIPCWAQEQDLSKLKEQAEEFRTLLKGAAIKNKILARTSVDPKFHQIFRERLQRSGYSSDQISKYIHQMDEIVRLAHRIRKDDLNLASKVPHDLKKRSKEFISLLHVHNSDPKRTDPMAKLMAINHKLIKNKELWRVYQETFKEILGDRENAYGKMFEDYVELQGMKGRKVIEEGDSFTTNKIPPGMRRIVVKRNPLGRRHLRQIDGKSGKPL